MLARCLAAGVGIGLLLGLLAAPGTDTGTGALVALLGALLGAGLGGLTAVALDAADVTLPELPRPAMPEPAAIVVEDDDLGPLVPAGWYPDPAGGGERRYWDGESWA